MTTEAFEKFRSQVDADKALQAAVAACFSGPASSGSNGFDKLSALGKSHGFDFTAQEAQGATGADGATLSEFELNQVSAGANLYTNEIMPVPYKRSSTESAPGD